VAGAVIVERAGEALRSMTPPRATRCRGKMPVAKNSFAACSRPERSREKCCARRARCAQRL